MRDALGILPVGLPPSEFAGRENAGNTRNHREFRGAHLVTLLGQGPSVKAGLVGLALRVRGSVLRRTSVFGQQDGIFFEQGV